MKRTSISTRIWLVLGLFASGMLINSYLETSNTRQAVQACYQGNVEHVVDIAKSILQHYHARQVAGELTQDEAQTLALEAISAIRFDNGNYIFMGDEAGIAISNGIKELVGTNILGMQDPTGLPLVRNLYDVAADGGGFVDYQWPDPRDKSTLLPKTSYADYFVPWKWTLGSGLNMVRLQRDLHEIQQANLINLVLVMISVGILAIFFVHSANQQIKKLVVAMRELVAGHGDLKHRLPVEGGKEVAEIAETYNQLVSSLEDMAQGVQRDGQRFLSAMQRMQSSSVEASLQTSQQLTLENLQVMVAKICNQAEALEQAHEALKEMAEQDSTTGLLSPQAFEAQVREHLLRLDANTPNTFVLLDFDRSNQAGRVMAEQVSTAAGIIRHALPNNGLASYIPEKGFVYWCSYTDASEGMRLAIALQQQMQKELGAEQCVSIGFSAMLGGHKSYELLFSEAERALIRAQREGGNRVYEY